jgi:hypothetical protein
LLISFSLSTVAMARLTGLQLSPRERTSRRSGS